MGLVDVVKQAQAMLDLSLDKELRTTMGKNARKFAEEKFDWNQITTQVEKILKEASETPHPLGNNSLIG
jgi:glycosyltransferase involved in cell wall biosynthesis